MAGVLSESLGKLEFKPKGVSPSKLWSFAHQHAKSRDRISSFKASLTIQVKVRISAVAATVSLWRRTRLSDRSKQT